MQEPLFNNKFQKLQKENNQDILISWSNIDLKVQIQQNKKNITKHILKDVSGYAVSGECLAILGSSGAGKSSLLNIIADKFDSSSNVILWKNVNINQEKLVWKKYQQIIGFVSQNDIFLEYLTLRETLQYIIDLFYSEYSYLKKQHLLNKTIQDLKLETCENNLVGGETKGISGGQKRRLSIAQELLKNP